MPAAERQAHGRDVRRAQRPFLQLILLVVLAAGALIAVRAELRAEPKADPASADAALVLASDATLGESLRAGDKSIARKLLSLQFSYTDENGEVHARKEFLDDLKSVASAAPTDAKATVYGSVAMVTGHRKLPPDGDTFTLHIWAKQKGTWRILTMQDVGIGAEGSPPAATDAPEAPGIVANLYECKNPCQTIPYRVRSPAEQDIVNAYQSVEKANIAHDADEYSKHIADEFVHYRSGYPPLSKSARLTVIEHQKEHNIPALLSAIQSMRLWVYGDGAAMISTNGVPDNAEPLLRIARVWVKRNNQWQLAVSVQTVVKPSVKQ